MTQLGALFVNEILPDHLALITGSGIAPEVARARGYRSITKRSDLRRLGFGDNQCRVPALLIPIHGVGGDVVTYQIRPDDPRMRLGKAIKYETPAGTRMVLDLPPPARLWLADPANPLFITEGARKADAAVSRNLCCVALLGVWNWRGTNDQGGKVALPDWECIALNGRDVYIVFDSDVMEKPEVHAALDRLTGFLRNRKACVRVIYLPPGEAGKKIGLDDYLVNHSVPELLGLATDKLRPVAGDSRLLVPGSYFIQDGRLCWAKPTRDGAIITPLCNFEAAVTEEVILDDGVDRTRTFAIQGTLNTGEPLPSVRIPASRFTGMGWVPEAWGVRAVVNAGFASREHLRAAIQILSPAAPRKTVFVHTGWTEIDGEFAYLTASGAVGRSDLQVDLGPELRRYSLPNTPDNPIDAMRCSLKLLDIAPLTVTVPLFAAVYRAPLASILPVDLTVWLEGQTGSLKSTLAALFLSHYGDFDRQHLPGAWISTTNQLERRAFLLKDALFPIDDYAPSGRDVKEMEVKAARLIRSQGNSSGRGRLKADLTERPTHPPRGLILSTGEQHPPGQSILARMVLVELERESIDLIGLTEAQKEKGRLPHAFAGYIRHLAARYRDLPGMVSKVFEQTRMTAISGDGHLRIPEAVAQLFLGLHLVMNYIEEIGACSPAQAADLRTKGWEALMHLGHSQSRLVSEERPVLRFLRVLSSLLTRGRHLLRHRIASLPEGESGGAQHLGWYDDEHLYLDPEAAYTAVAIACRDSGEIFPTPAVRLRKDLSLEGLSECDPDRNTKTVKIAGKTRRVLCLRRSAVNSLLEEDFLEPSPVVTGVTGS